MGRWLVWLVVLFVLACSDSSPRKIRLSDYLNEVPPGTERVLCLDVGTQINEARIAGWHVERRAAAHHVNLFLSPRSEHPSPGKCSMDPGTYTSIFSSSQPQLDYRLPRGAFVVPAGSVYVAEVHELNTTDGPLEAQVAVDLLYGSDGSPVVQDAVLVNNHISVAPGAEAMIFASCPAPVALEIVSMTSHSHSHTSRVSATLYGGGVQIYESDDWAEPMIYEFLPPLKLAAGETLDWSCDIVNDTSALIKSGLSPTSAEMCAINAVAIMEKPWFCLK